MVFVSLWRQTRRALRIKALECGLEASGTRRAVVSVSWMHTAEAGEGLWRVPSGLGSLRGADKIGGILKAGIGSTAVPIYECAAAEAQAVRRSPVGVRIVVDGFGS